MVTISDIRYLQYVCSVAHLLANQGWVDIGFGCFTLCLVLPGLMGIWQKWLSSWARWWNIPNQSQPNPGSPGYGPLCTYHSFFIFHCAVISKLPDKGSRFCDWQCTQVVFLSSLWFKLAEIWYILLTWPNFLPILSTEGQENATVEAQNTKPWTSIWRPINEAKSEAGNHWLQLSPSLALLRGQVWSSLGIRCQQQHLVD